MVMRTPEERAAGAQRILQMGRLRYTLIFGILGNGLGYALVLMIAIFPRHAPFHWGLRVFLTAVAAILFGSLHGLRTWKRIVCQRGSYSPPSALQ